MWSVNLSGTVDEISTALNNMWAVMSDGEARDLFLSIKGVLHEACVRYEGPDYPDTRQLRLTANGDLRGLQITVEVL